MPKLHNCFLLNWLMVFLIIFLFFFIGIPFSFAQYPPTPTPTPTPTSTSPPAVFCGNGNCDWGETCSTCPQDCGVCPPPGYVECGGGTCADGTTYFTYCTPNCTSIPRTCFDTPSCIWPPPHCAEGGCPPGICPTVAHCGPDVPPDCGVVLCNCPGGNCYSDCSACLIITPTPTLPPPPPGDYRVIGRVTRDGSVQNYSAYEGRITSSDGKIDRRLDDTGYWIGRWACSSSLVITMDPGWAPGYSCTWAFDNDPWGPGGGSSGGDCSAEIILGCGDTGSQNHLWFSLSPALSRTCDPDIWQDVACGGGTCADEEMYQVRYFYWSDGSGVCEIEEQCVPDPSCQIKDAWFQTKSGDVHAEGNMASHTGGDIRSTIPSTCEPDLDCDPNFSLVDEDTGLPGIVSFSPGGSADFGEGYCSADSATHWLAEESAYRGKKYGYDYFDKLVGVGTTAPYGDGRVNQNKLDDDIDASLARGDEGVVVYDGDVETSSTWNARNTKAVIFINGKFLINHKIPSGPGGSMVIITKEGIGVSKNVVATGEGNNIVRAVFITDGIFYSSVEPGDFPTFNTADSDKKLVIDGAVIAWENFNLTGRTFDENSTEPVELYRYDPAILLDSNQKLWQSKFTWQELAP